MGNNDAFVTMLICFDNCNMMYLSLPFNLIKGNISTKCFVIEENKHLSQYLVQIFMQYFKTHYTSLKYCVHLRCKTISQNLFIPHQNGLRFETDLPFYIHHYLTRSQFYLLLAFV